MTFRTRPLTMAVLCTAALAACSDSATGTGRGGDPLVNATNQNLGAEIVFEATQSETVMPGAALQISDDTPECSPVPYDPVYSVSGSESGVPSSHALAPIQDPCGPTYPYPPPPPPVTPPSFAIPVGTITGSTSLGTKTVNLNASGSFTYASFGQLTAIFQNVGGCPTTAPSEYSRSTVSAENAPFTLSA
ncbi:MAG TPA: hypothetical protein VEQ60_11010, partial [Longimicrobium sp.]|nr:hypothetical protein [Longimicrobium sp.]